jgi:putative transcriptional regulator
MSRGGVVRDDRAAGEVGARIRGRRKELGLTQADLAIAVQVSRQTVITLENGGCAPSVYLALRVAQTLGTTVEALWFVPEAGS